MAQGPRRDPNKERFWRRTLRDWRRSGLSIRDFCARHGLSEPVFYAWRRTLAQRDDAKRHRTQALATASASPQTGNPASFVPIDVIEQRPGPALEIVLANGRIVRVTPGCDRALLVHVVEALEGRSC